MAEQIMMEWWNCNVCGIEFNYLEAESVEDGESGECVVACPRCMANILDDWDSVSYLGGRSH